MQVEKEIELVDRPTKPPLGAGEAACTTVGAALANAVFDAIGIRLRTIPFTPERVKAAERETQLSSRSCERPLMSTKMEIYAFRPSEKLTLLAVDNKVNANSTETFLAPKLLEPLSASRCHDRFDRTESSGTI